MINRKKQNARQDKWKKEHQDTICIRIPKGNKAKWQAQAEAEGLSLTQFIIEKVGI